MAIGVLTLKIFLPGCASLKEKRRRLKPLLTRLQREFNVSVAELDYQDVWQSSQVGCAILCNDVVVARRSMQQVVKWIEIHWQDISIEEEKIEIL